MPEFSVGGLVRGASGAGSLTNMPTPILASSLPPLLPTADNPVGSAIVEEAGNALRGRAETPAVDEKIGKTLVKKLIRGGPIGEAISDVLFGGNKAGAPDPSGRRGPLQFDESGAPFRFNERGERIDTQMLDMWMADP